MSPSNASVTPEYAPHARAERLIAAGRFVLAFFSLLAVYAEPSTPARYEESTYTLLVIYTLYALGVVVYAWRSPVPPMRWRLFSHALDLVLFTIFIYLTEGPASPFFLYFVFSLFCATLRFSWTGILTTAVTAVGIYGVLVSIAWGDPTFEPSRVLIREVYLAVIAALLVYLGIHQQRLRFELASLAAWPRELEPDLPAVLRSTLAHAVSVLRAEFALLTWEESEEPWTYAARWMRGRIDVDRVPPRTDDELPTPAVLLNTSFFVRGAGEPILVYDPRRSTVEEIAGITCQAAFEPSVVVCLATENLTVRLCVAWSRTATADDLALAHIAGRLVLAQLEQYFFVLQVRLTASTEERLRISRELHDGVVQSLGGAGLQLQAIRSRLQPESEAAASLERVQQVIEHDQKELREIVRELRPHDPRDGGTILLDELQRMAGRFSIEWGMDVAFEIPRDLGIPARAAHEVSRIVNESLSNAARHGRATSASVAVAASDRAVEVSVTDNGCGFPFTGRYDLHELNRNEYGPRMLKERLATLGGKLTIESSPSGASIRALVPVSIEGGR